MTHLATGSEALLVYPAGDADTVTVLSLTDAHAVVRTPRGQTLTVEHEDIGIGVDPTITATLDDGTRLEPDGP